MRYRQIEVFHAVMTYGTVTKAAQNLGVSQPSVTSSIQNSEEEFGFSLFDRTGGRLFPTAEARILFDEVGRAHSSFLAVEGLCKRLREGSEGHIRIAAIPTLSQRLLPAAITNFQKIDQRSTFDISSEHSTEILSNLGDCSQSYHLGFTFGVGKKSDLRSEKLIDIPVYCVIPKTFIENMKEPPSGDEPIDLQVIASLPYIDLYENEPLGRISQFLLLAAGVSPSSLVRVHDHHIAASLVHNGLGVAILDALTIYNLQQSESVQNIMVYKLAGDPVLPITAVFSQNRTLTSPIRNFMSCMVYALETIMKQ